MVCGDDARPNVCHALCEGCTLRYLEHLREDPLRGDASVTCPCQSGRPFALSHAVRREHSRVVRERAERRTSAVKKCLLEEQCETALVPRCPHCRTAVFDFDGCCAVRCLCRKYFCALCMRGFEGSAECHSHVLACRLNDTGSYYAPRRTLVSAQRRMQSERIWRGFLVCLREHNVFYAISFIVSAKERGGSIFPSKSVTFFTCVFVVYVLCAFPLSTISAACLGSACCKSSARQALFGRVRGSQRQMLDV